MSALTRRSRFTAAAAVGLGVALAATGCATGNSDTAASYAYVQGDEPVEITFWSAAVEDINKDLVEQFNEGPGTELGIHVTAEYQGDYVETEQKVNAAAVAETLPNVFVDEVGMTKRFAESDIALDLTPYMEATEMTDEDFQVGEIGNLYYDEQMHALPYMRSVPVMFVNRDMMRQLGLNENGPETLEELEEYLQKAHDLVGGPAMIFCDADFWVMEALLYSYGDTSVLNEDETASVLGDEGAVATVEWIADLEERGLVKVTGAAEAMDFFAASGNPNTAFTFTTSGAIQAVLGLAAGNGVDVGVSLIPAGPDDQRGVSVGGSNVYLANTGTDNEKAAAFEFMSWLTDTDQTAYASSLTGYLPIRASAYETDVMKEVMATIPGYDVAAEQIEYGRTRPMPKSYTEIEQLMIERIHAMIFDDTDIEVGMADLAEDVDEVLNR